MDSFCYLPNVHLQLKPNGIVKPCCRFDVAEAKKLAPPGSPLSALNSESWHQLRNELKSTPPAGCYKCVQEENAGLQSMRLRKSELARYEIQEEEHRLLDLEIGFGNLCNLACRSCDSSLSSKWYEDDVFISSQPEFNRPRPEKRSINLGLENIPVSDLKHLKNIKFTGGEPILHEDFSLFLQSLVDANISSTVKLRICTNSSYIPREKIVNLLCQFSSVEISVSIDGFGEQNDYMRFHSQWKNTLEAVNFWKSLVQENPDWTMNLCATISAYSLESLSPLMSWWTGWLDSGSTLKTKYKVIFQPAYNPYYLAPSLLPKEVVALFPEIKNHHAGKYFNSSTATVANVAQFLSFTKLLDERRKESFSKVFPKLSEALNEWLTKNKPLGLEQKSL